MYDRLEVPCAQMSRMLMSHREELYYRQSKDKGIYTLFIWWNNAGLVIVVVIVVAVY